MAAQKYSQYLREKSDNHSEIKLAHCYTNLHHYADAERQFEKVINMPEISSVDYLAYARVLKRNGKYSEASKWYVEYLLENPTHKNVKDELSSCDSIEQYKKNLHEYDVALAPFNTDASSFSPVYYKDGLVFCSDRTMAGNTSQISNRTGHSYLDLYFVQPDQSCHKPNAVLFSANLNSNFHEGPCCFSSDGNTIYFTRNVLNEKSSPEKTKTNINNFCIYKSYNVNGLWSAPELVDLGTSDYSAGHPALSKDGNRLYFISDMPGGSGGTDIYFSNYNITTGKWSPAINAGTAVNTSGNEMFLSLTNDAEGNEYLYFSSDGREGSGGLDIYFSAIANPSFFCNVVPKNDAVSADEAINQGFSKPVHLYAPLNSSGDDFGMIFSADGIFGYFSSDRDNQEGTDKIYSFKKNIPEFFIEVLLTKKGTSDRLPNAQIELFDYNNNRSVFAATDSNGVLFRKINQNSSLVITGRKSGFFTASIEAGNVGKIKSDTIFITLELEGIELNKPIVLENIYYDYKKWDIRADAAIELDKLVKILNDNPEIHIELSSHTDSRGSDKYNMNLSQKRAQSAVDYIVGKGIGSERIYAKGYGESRLRNKCANKVKCTDEEHQLNRRTEFSVVKIVRELVME